MTIRAAVVPAAPVYVPGVNASPSPDARRLTAAIARALCWAAGADAPGEGCCETSAAVPADASSADAGPAGELCLLLGSARLVGLGPYGIDRGLDVRTGALLTGAAWRTAAAALSQAERAAAQAACCRCGALALHAHAAGLGVRPWEGQRQAGIAVSYDFSARSTPDGPLAPMPGAKDHDEAIMGALSTGSLDALDALADAEQTFASDTAGVRELLSRLGEPHSVTVDADAEVCGTRTAVVRMEFA